MTSDPEWRLIVVAPTFYSSLDDTRYLLGVQSCQNAAQHRIRLLLVDASPNDKVRLGLEAAGRGFVTVFQQTSKGKKGSALREAMALARDECLANSAQSTIIIGFQELEKEDMFRHWELIASHLIQAGADVVVPRRKEQTFRETYPIEQYHCESFANLYLDSLGLPLGIPSIDWTMGPVAFRLSQVHHWLDFDGDLWDAQLVPLIRSHLAGGKVISSEVEYCHPLSMKLEEQGVSKWNQKRLHQLNFLKDTVGKELSAHTSKTTNS